MAIWFLVLITFPLVVFPTVKSNDLDILFPISSTVQWTPLNPEVIECSYPSSVPKLLNATKLVGSAPILRDDYLVDGFLCLGLRLRTRCSTGWLGSNTIEYLEEHFSPSESTCSDKIKETLEGQQNLIAYPPESCTWLKTSTEVSEYVKITKKSMMYDPYKNLAVSELFVKGSCKDNFCSTLHTGLYWVPNHHQRPQCISKHLDQVVFYVHSSNPDLVDIWSPDLNIPSGHKLCLLTFCGTTGLLFQDGTWIGLPPAPVATITRTGYNFQSVKSCDEGTHLSMMEREYTVHVAEQSILDKFMETECLKTKEALILGNPVSRVQLQSLAPRVPGRYRVYRLVNNSLETGISDYRYVNLMAPTGNNPIVVKDGNNKIIKYNYWVTDDTHHVIDGPNGLFIYKNTLSYHNADLMDYQRALSLSLKQKVNLPGVQFLPVKESDKNGVITKYAKLIEEDLKDNQWFHWSNIGSIICYMVLAVMVMITIVLSWRIYTCLSMPCKGRYAGRRQIGRELDAFYRS